MFICGFISFTVWSSFTVRIISLSRSHIPPLRPRPRPSRSTLPASSMAIKILSATLLKNYRASPSSASSSCSSRKPLSLTPIEYELVAFSLPLYLTISPLYLLWFVWVSTFCPRRAAVSTIRLLFRVYSLLDSLFPLVACVCLVLSPFVRLMLVNTALGVCSMLIFYLSFPLSFSFSLSLSCNLFSSLSLFHLSLAIFRL